MPILLEEERERKLKRCALAAKVALKYGPIKSARIRQEHIDEFAEDPVSHLTIHKDVKSRNIKWYIHNKIVVDHPIWTADFIAGITKTGKINWSKYHYPSFAWWGSPFLSTILEDCPYYGKIKAEPLQKYGFQKHEFMWQRVPALYLKPNYSTLSYVAGLLCTGRKSICKNQMYAMYQGRIKGELKKLGIPIERENFRGKKFLISPFWPALFTKFMPECCRDYWLDIKTPYNANEYAAIMWLTYSTHDIKRKGLPYLQARRTVFYKFKNEKGTLAELQKLRIKYNFMGLDKRFKECMKVWIENA